MLCTPHQNHSVVQINNEMDGTWHVWGTRVMYQICGLLGNYTASCGNYLPTFRDNVSVPSSRVKIRYAVQFLYNKLSFLIGIMTREDGTDTLSRNVGK
jgi:hypothetical protein